MPLQSSRPALTLLEVVAALALLTSLLVATLDGFTRQAQQIAKSRLRLEAIELSDRLLYDWTNSPKGIPVPARGSFASRADLQWQTSLVDRSYAPSLGIDIVRFEARDVQTADDQPPLVQLELFVVAKLRPAPSTVGPTRQRRIR